MYPTLMIGLVLLVTALRYARDPVARRWQLTRRLSMLTLLSSALGFVTGVITTCTHLPDAAAAGLPPGVMVAVGIGESLVNVAFGLLLITVATIVTTATSVRANAGAELADPHRPA